MTKIICSMNCVHKSKRALSGWLYNDGRKCYKCALDVITIINQTDDVIRQMYDNKEFPCCKYFEEEKK